MDLDYHDGFKERAEHKDGLAAAILNKHYAPTPSSPKPTSLSSKNVPGFCP